MGRYCWLTWVGLLVAGLAHVSAFLLNAAEFQYRIVAINHTTNTVTSATPLRRKVVRKSLVWSSIQDDTFTFTNAILFDFDRDGFHPSTVAANGTYIASIPYAGETELGMAIGELGNATHHRVQHALVYPDAADTPRLTSAPPDWFQDLDFTVIFIDSTLRQQLVDYQQMAQALSIGDPEVDGSQEMTVTGPATMSRRSLFRREVLVVSSTSDVRVELSLRRVDPSTLEPEDSNLTMAAWKVALATLFPTVGFVMCLIICIIYIKRRRDARRQQSLDGRAHPWRAGDPIRNPNRRRRRRASKKKREVLTSSRLASFPLIQLTQENICQLTATSVLSPQLQRRLTAQSRRGRALSTLELSGQEHLPTTEWTPTDCHRSLPSPLVQFRSAPGLPVYDLGGRGDADSLNGLARRHTLSHPMDTHPACAYSEPPIPLTPLTDALNAAGTPPSPGSSDSEGPHYFHVPKITSVRRAPAKTLPRRMVQSAIHTDAPSARPRLVSFLRYSSDSREQERVPITHDSSHPSDADGDSGFGGSQVMGTPRLLRRFTTSIYPFFRHSRDSWRTARSTATTPAHNGLREATPSASPDLVTNRSGEDWATLHTLDLADSCCSGTNTPNPSSNHHHRRSLPNLLSACRVDGLGPCRLPSKSSQISLPSSSGQQSLLSKHLSLPLLWSNRKPLRHSPSLATAVDPWATRVNVFIVDQGDKSAHTHHESTHCSYHCDLDVAQAVQPTGAANIRSPLSSPLSLPPMVPLAGDAPSKEHDDVAEQLWADISAPSPSDALLATHESLPPRLVTSLTSASIQTLSGPLCTICLETYSIGDVIRQLPCGHVYHPPCIDLWLTEKSTQCPLCKADCRDTQDAST
ncbi:hypothetical protein H4R34_000505 [Dimargaris verticillata]|uniref:RING-type domain-containing protein n=1 Tax=Dimargaris verticillata TaxID=2761393 RepID=A0A9W8EFB4_9FUNG|nr:hypothetical protein H4R34_000505 [Dimargaris verticillata]